MILIFFPPICYITIGQFRIVYCIYHIALLLSEVWFVSGSRTSLWCDFLGERYNFDGFTFSSFTFLTCITEGQHRQLRVYRQWTIFSSWLPYQSVIWFPWITLRFWRFHVSHLYPPQNVILRINSESPNRSMQQANKPLPTVTAQLRMPRQTKETLNTRADGF